PARCPHQPLRPRPPPRPARLVTTTSTRRGPTMHRTVYFAGVALLLVTVAFLVTDRLPWHPGVTEANVRRIRPGMTQTQVEAILGGPCDSGGGRRVNGPDVWVWTTGSGQAVVHVSDQQVTATEWWPPFASSPR